MTSTAIHILGMDMIFIFSYCNIFAFSSWPNVFLFHTPCGSLENKNLCSSCIHIFVFSSWPKVFPFQTTCHSLENNILSLSFIHIHVSYHATIRQRNDTLGNDTWSEMGKHCHATKKVSYLCLFMKNR